VRCNGEALPGAVQPGDLAVWDGHVAMIVGNGTMIEARCQLGVEPPLSCPEGPWGAGPAAHAMGRWAEAMQRPGDADEIASAAVYLASDMSSCITGQTIHVDDGTRAADG
jgi:NAD(P)-dependent dehydrogenase (short-subunit alcohol dehydrogenase family)